MTPEDKSKIEFALSRFKSGQINSGQVVREIEKMYDDIEQDLKYTIEEYDKSTAHYESVLSAANRRIAELEKELGIY